MTTPPQRPPPRPPMRSSDVFRIVAVDDEALVLRRLEDLAAQAVHPRCFIDTFTALGPNILPHLSSPPHLLILDDDLSLGACGEISIASLRSAGYFGPIAILSGLRRPHRNPDLVRAGAMIYLAKDDLGMAAFYELIDMAMALSKIMRYRRQPTTGNVASRPRADRRVLDVLP